MGKRSDYYHIKVTLYFLTMIVIPVYCEYLNNLPYLFALGLILRKSLQIY